MICEAQCLHSTSDEPPFVESALLIDYIYKAKDTRKRRSSGGSSSGANTDLNTPSKRIKSFDPTVNSSTNLLTDTTKTTVIHKKFYSFAERYWFNNEYNHQKGLKLGQGKDSPVPPSDVILANVAKAVTGEEEAAYGNSSCSGDGEIKIGLPEGSGMHMRFDSTTTNTSTTNNNNIDSASTSCTTTTDTVTTVVTSEDSILVQSE